MAKKTEATVESKLRALYDLQLIDSRIDEIISLSDIKTDIDFINIDVEGSDYKILTQINIQKLKPKLISIETHNVDGSESENFQNINDYLINNNFQSAKIPNLCQGK